MRLLHVMNGWREAPHHWWRYLLLPLRYERTPAWVSLGLFGFTFFVEVE